jgi:hypothetical protein
MDQYDTDPRRIRAATCPRAGCGRQATAGTAAVSICSRGHEWHIEPVEVVR